MTSSSESVHIDILANIADISLYNKTYHTTIKMNSTYIDFGIQNNGEDTKFEVGDNVRISVMMISQCHFVKSSKVNVIKSTS